MMIPHCLARDDMPPLVASPRTPIRTEAARVQPDPPHVRRIDLAIRPRFGKPRGVVHGINSIAPPRIDGDRKVPADRREPGGSGRRPRHDHFREIPRDRPVTPDGPIVRPGDGMAIGVAVRAADDPGRGPGVRGRHAEDRTGAADPR